MGIEGIGARVARKEDKRFITGAGRYVDDMVVPGMKHAVFVQQSARACRDQEDRRQKGQGDAGRHRRADRQGAEGRRHRQSDLRLDDPFQGRLADEDGRVVAAGVRPGALCRRRGGRRRCRDEGPGARRGRSRRDHLQGTAVGHRRVEGDGQGPAAAPSRSGKQPDLRLGPRQCRRDRRGLQDRPRMSSSSTSSTTG